MKQQRHIAIRELLVTTSVLSQDELRKKLAKRGFTVTQATLSRDIHELRVMKGPHGYALPDNGSDDESDGLGIRETLANYGLQVRQAQNLVVVITITSSAQPVAAALDYEDWPEVIGTIAGDDTVLVICADGKQAAVVKTRMEGLIVK
jgi:transcriptional regulator of arginine metabolism